MDYQIGQEVNYAGKQGIIKQVYDGGWYQVEVGSQLKDAFFDEINSAPKIIYPGRNGQIGGVRQAGSISNSIIQRRNGGVRHQFQDSIGGDSSNYR